MSWRNIQTKVAVAAAMALCGSATNAYASAGCSALAGTFTNGAVTGNQSATGFSAGDLVTVNITAISGTADVHITISGGSIVAGPVSTPTTLTYTVPSTTAGSIFVLAGNSNTSTFNWSCTAGSGGGSGSSSGGSSAQMISQTVNNAQAAVSNGQQTLQNLNNWVANGVMGSFGLIGSSPGGGKPQAARSSAQLKALGATRRLEQLALEERTLREEQAERPQDAGLATRIAEVRSGLRYARVSASIAAGPAAGGGTRMLSPAVAPEYAGRLDPLQGPQPQIAPDMQLSAADGSTPQQSPSASFKFGAQDLIGLCEPEDELAQYNPARDMLGQKWNVWGEGRFVGAWDSLAQTKSWGLIGSGGVDYKFTPWLAVGVSVGVETFETKFGTQGVRTGSLGVTVMPYAGLRLADNVFASVFVGLTPITYNSNPQPNSTAGFNALRVLAGGALFGNWQLGGDWRVRPSLSGTYGSETQYGYTDSLGNVVGGQVVSYGRLSAGPEIGYTFWSADKSWSVEPYILARANLDFASSNSTVLQGQSVVLRPGTLGSGSAGLGIDARLSNGAYFRIQGSYDSIGVTGLDVVSGVIRAGLTF